MQNILRLNLSLSISIDFPGIVRMLYLYIKLLCASADFRTENVDCVNPSR